MSEQTRSIVSPPATTRPRLFYLDNLRIALTVLVVVHHAAGTYSGIPMVWFYSEPVTDPSADFLAGMLMINQSFFMGAFFFISGLFVPGSYDRKGAGRFFKDRLVRLGIPLLIFVVLLRPLVNYGFYPPIRDEVAQQGIELPYWLFYLFSWDPGPMWFVELLLVFSAGYLLFRRLRKNSHDPVRRQPAPLIGNARTLAILGFAVGLALVTYLWRMVVPIGTSVPILGLPTVAYLPQYTGLFVVGLIAARRSWIEGLPKSVGYLGFAGAVLGAAGVVAMFQSTGDAWVGLGSLHSLVMAVCESAVAVGLLLALLVLFRDRLPRQGSRGRFLSERAYTVYFTHALVLVALGYALSGVAAPAVVKFGVLAALGVPLCWLFAHCVRALPGAKKVL
ncbi:acyltransferase family protein [Actinoalloteichus hymeniacidonis]|uniref:Acetyltransferase, fucose-4-O-acetylase n=1 Tax=Actinoalloteichus hymeniacidonis TaxID=340345 RepID=A0AAC9HRF1_9PSEU|nr:acyltransferase family protein [Actinoalloteichus hymeniacidonis]AOS63954.1 acetyltransferase, fucose-4-O-acetylase [Actinoalloteichus hymeniacidonis]MBB5907989.1 fucose 4-O-acetylase-like acetyltransferase [Actinoalloteichus hymeniacidonis]